MIARTLPFQNGAITQFKMVLPHHWTPVLTGNADAMEMLPVVEQEAIKDLTNLFGKCVDVDDSVNWANHDAMGYGVAPDLCSVYTFVEMH